jgi:hypothetical protein
MLSHQPHLVHAVVLRCMRSHHSLQIRIVTPQPRSGGNSSDRNPLFGSKRISHLTTRDDLVLVYLLALLEPLGASRGSRSIILEPSNQPSALSRNLLRLPTDLLQC